MTDDEAATEIAEAIRAASERIEVQFAALTAVIERVAAAVERQADLAERVMQQRPPGKQARPLTESRPEVAKKSMLTDHEVQEFLRQLQQYRASLNEVAQQLLDALVAVGLGYGPPGEPDDEVRTYWVAYHHGVDPPGGAGYGTPTAPAPEAADWARTPWGSAYRRGEPLSD